MLMLMFAMKFSQCGGPNNASDLEKQPFYKFLEKTYAFHPVALAALLYALGGFPFLVWGMVKSIFLFFTLYLLPNLEIFILICFFLGNCMCVCLICIQMKDSLMKSEN